MTLVSVESARMLAQPGFLARFFRVFERHGISVDVVATSEVSVSVTLDREDGLADALADLEELGRLAVERDLGLVCVVGQGLARRTGIPARVFGPLADRGITVRMVSMGSLKVNLSLVLDAAAVPEAVRALHEEFFAGAQACSPKAGGS